MYDVRHIRCIRLYTIKLANLRKSFFCLHSIIYYTTMVGSNCRLSIILHLYFCLVQIEVEMQICNLFFSDLKFVHRRSRNLSDVVFVSRSRERVMSTHSNLISHRQNVKLVCFCVVQIEVEMQICNLFFFRFQIRSRTISKSLPKSFSSRALANVT